MGSSIDSVGEAINFDNLSNGRQGLSDSLDFYLMSRDVDACPDSRSECCEVHVTDDGVKGLESREKVDSIFVTIPVVPVRFPGSISRLQDSRVNFCPGSGDVKRENKFDGKFNFCQKVAYGK